jgi:hypothetical protein
MTGLSRHAASNRTRHVLAVSFAIAAFAAAPVLPSLHVATAHACDAHEGANPLAGSHDCTLCSHFNHDLGHAELVAIALVEAATVAWRAPFTVVVATTVVAAVPSARAPPLPV